jgi:hypothetical protein
MSDHRRGLLVPHRAGPQRPPRGARNSRVHRDRQEAAQAAGSAREFVLASVERVLLPFLRLRVHRTRQHLLAALQREVRHQRIRGPGADAELDLPRALLIGPVEAMTPIRDVDRGDEFDQRLRTPVERGRQLVVLKKAAPARTMSERTRIGRTSARLDGAIRSGGRL